MTIDIDLFKIDQGAGKNWLAPLRDDGRRARAKERADAMKQRLRARFQAQRAKAVPALNESEERAADELNTAPLVKKLRANEKAFQAALARWYGQIGNAVVSRIKRRKGDGYRKAAVEAITQRHRDQLRQIVEEHLHRSASISAELQWRLHPNAGDVQESLLDFAKGIPALVASSVRKAVTGLMMVFIPDKIIEPIIDRIEAVAKMNPDRLKEELFDKEKIKAWADGLAVTKNTEGANLGTTATGGILEAEGIVNAKRWLTLHGTGALDEKVRDSHAEVNGKTVGLKEKFILSKKDGGTESCDGPGDPGLSAGNSRHCRCLKVYVYDPAFPAVKKLAESAEVLEAAASALPKAPPRPDAGHFTGVDSHGHKWQDGKQVKIDRDAPAQRQKAKLRGQDVDVVARDSAHGLVRVKTPAGDKVVRTDELDFGTGAAPAAPAAAPAAPAAEPKPGMGDSIPVSDVFKYLHEKGAAGFGKLPAAVQKAIIVPLKVAFSAWTASQKLAEEISLEKGASPDEAMQLRSTLAAYDLAAFKPVGSLAVALGPATAVASWIVPPITGVYLAHSAVMHPLATYRAARNVIKDAVESSKKFVDEHTQVLEAAAPPAGGATPEQELLTAALVRHGYDAWYNALLHAALEETKDAAQAVAAADKAFAANPKDSSTPQPDDADALFGGKKGE